MQFPPFVRLCICLLLSTGSLWTPGSCFGQSDQVLPMIPIGEDAYLQWERWPYQRIGARAYMRSTYDRRGGNESADASHFLYQEADDFNVTLDVEGRGVLYFVRTNHWHGSPWTYEVDGIPHLVKESSTATPNQPVENSVFIPSDVFPEPLCWTWSATKGADLMWRPVPFEESFRLAYGRTHYGTGYYIYHHYMDGAPLSRPITSFEMTPPDPAVLELLGSAGSDIAPPGVTLAQGTRPLAADRIVLADLQPSEPQMIRAIKLSLPLDQAVELGRQTRLRITWDGRRQASVDAPLALFFGAGTLYNRDQREYLVKALPVNIRFDYEKKVVELACYFPMPFLHSMKMELVGSGVSDGSGEITYEVRGEPFRDPMNHVGYFHATYRDFPKPIMGRDIVLLDTGGLEGNDFWSGSFVGTSFIFSHRAYLRTLEGDPRFFFDDSRSPQAYGTGTEEWGGGGDYWGGRNMTLPLAGHPVGAPDPQSAHNEEDLIQSAYRFLLADLMPFGRRAQIHLEHGGGNQAEEHYETVTYWYGYPGASLVLTDELDIGDLASEEAHAYISPRASVPYELTSRFELGPDTQKLINIDYPTAQSHDYAEFEFEADADKTYYIWLRGRALYRNTVMDSSWLQFDEMIGTTQMHESYASEVGAGNWGDATDDLRYRWASERPGGRVLSVTFDTSGTHRLRLQTRQTLHMIDQIWLSATQEIAPNDSGPREKPETPIPGQINQIVLDAGDVVESRGGVNVMVPDPEASLGYGLLMDVHEFELYPTHSDEGRFTTGTSEFTLTLDPENHGVLLRRLLDYQYPNQRAEVYIADASRGLNARDAKWERAGVWFLAGSNTCVFSNPPGELGETQHVVQTSNRRFREDEFLVPSRLTQGRSRIRVRVAFNPVDRQLFPGYEFPVDSAWSEMHYKVYCYQLPAIQFN